MKVRINPQYATEEAWIRQLARPGFFEENGETLHDGRNTIKRFEHNGRHYAVKRYGRLSLLNRCIYGILRKSKAERAFQHAARLRELGIDTPEEVAMLETRRCGLLDKSYFVSLYSDYLPMGPVTELKTHTHEKVVILNALTEFLYRMHKQGVLHKDLNIGNILYNGNLNEGYRFQIIDINRMSFSSRLNNRQRLRNLRRLSCPAAAYLYILDRYAQLSDADPDSVQFHGVLLRLIFDTWQRGRHHVKAMLKRLGKH